MLHNKMLDGVTITELNKTGAYFKVLNCQTELRITMTRGGSNVLSTEVRSGFELSKVPFDKVIIESDTPQKVEIWASEYPLGYDAPTKGANTNLSGIIEHYGDSQQVLPFERNRVAVTLFSDTEPFWYGGEGVTPENGIPVPAGERRRIEGAGELHLAINKSASYGLTANHNFVANISSTEHYRAVGHVLQYRAGLNLYLIGESGVIDEYPREAICAFTYELDPTRASYLLNKSLIVDGAIFPAGASRRFLNAHLVDGKIYICGSDVVLGAVVWLFSDGLFQVVHSFSEYTDAHDFHYVGNELFVVVNLSSGPKKIVRASDGLNVAWVSGVNFVVTSSGSQVSFVSSRDLVLFDTISSSVIPPPIQGALSVFLGDEITFAITDSKIYQGVGGVYVEVENSSLIYGNANYRPKYYSIGGVFYMTAVNGGHRLVSYSAEVLKNTKAKIRMLKEVV